MKKPASSGYYHYADETASIELGQQKHETFYRHFRHPALYVPNMTSRNPKITLSSYIS